MIRRHPILSAGALASLLGLAACTTTPPTSSALATPQAFGWGFSAKARQAMAAKFGPTMLKPGDYVWQRDKAADGSTDVVISLSSQMAYVYRGGELVAASTISSGKMGAETPVGHFPVLQKNRTHKSNRYSNAPMPFMQRLTWRGVALHGGALPGYPASHGCIRLPMKFAEKLFAATSVGSNVYVED